ncbi:Metallo-hydrolase/oxidoreductase [Hypoxylon fragiforme]|uniref:Metallo-hydrolase/oxidoreductase n=1 Tax=Hypoxylon fragiforme TaxID=63214 RepID=UPI0020C68DF0|nr:Metallo-hydrolase/oxidoreductase [Hypoxylon fragiforme]KAI2614454.1 Metallo-hydrolase/oxidoreductase [Hypoxylon fragiforme]
MIPTRHLHLDPLKRQPLLKDQAVPNEDTTALPTKKVHFHPGGSGKDEDASVYFIGTATMMIEWQGIRILTDPNFLHAGDHVHLGPGVTAQRKTNPAVDLHELPSLDCILLSHYHEDHFDRLVENSLNRNFHIITTPHAKACLASGEAKEEPFRSVHGVDVFESMMLHIDRREPRLAGGYGKVPAIKVTGMPGKHVPPGALSLANSVLRAVPPTNGWLVELGYTFKAPTGDDPDTLDTGYRVYISGDTLFVDELREIPTWLRRQQQLLLPVHQQSRSQKQRNSRIDLMLVHLGGTTIPGPAIPLVMVTMDAAQGFRLMELMQPGVTIPVHYDDYSVFLSPLAEFKDKVDGEGWRERVVYLDRGEAFRFKVLGG